MPCWRTATASAELPRHQHLLWGCLGACDLLAADSRTTGARPAQLFSTERGGDFGNRAPRTWTGSTRHQRVAPVRPSAAKCYAHVVCLVGCARCGASSLRVSTIGWCACMRVVLCGMCCTIVDASRHVCCHQRAFHDAAMPVFWQCDGRNGSHEQHSGRTGTLVGGWLVGLSTPDFAVMLSANFFLRAASRHWWNFQFTYTVVVRSYGCAPASG